MLHSKQAVTRGMTTRTWPLKPSVPPSIYGMICGQTARCGGLCGVHSEWHPANDDTAAYLGRVVVQLDVAVFVDRYERAEQRVHPAACNEVVQTTYGTNVELQIRYTHTAKNYCSCVHVDHARRMWRTHR